MKSMMKKLEKKFWKIELNWYGETHLFYRWAVEKEFAISLGIFALAQELNLHWRAVSNHIRDGFDRYKATEVKYNNNRT